jgi:hypothetical protein
MRYHTPPRRPFTHRRRTPRDESRSNRRSCLPKESISQFGLFISNLGVDLVTCAPSGHCAMGPPRRLVEFVFCLVSEHLNVAHAGQGELGRGLVAPGCRRNLERWIARTSDSGARSDRLPQRMWRTARIARGLCGVSSAGGPARVERAIPKGNLGSVQFVCARRTSRRSWAIQSHRRRRTSGRMAISPPCG